MGYSTDFWGKLEVYPPLNKKEISFLKNFNETRRVVRSVDSDGRYYVENQNKQNIFNILQNNEPPIGQPSLWCGFKASDDGKSIVWDEGEKTYGAEKWIKYFITHFLGNNPLMESINPELYKKNGFTPHIINGLFYAKGENVDDGWCLIVNDNQVFVQNLKKEQFTRKEIDENSDENEEDVYERNQELWYSIKIQDFKNLMYEERIEVNYESKDINEMELNNSQEKCRIYFIDDMKANLDVIENAVKVNGGRFKR